METDPLIETLLTCLRSEDAETRAARLAPLTPDEWASLLRLAKRHGVMPLLYRCLQPQASAYKVPADILQALRKEYLANSSRNARLYQALGAGLQLFRRENLPVIVLKGAHLAEIVYRSIALRPMSDIDLLMRCSDLPRVESILLGNGYCPDPQNGPAMAAAHFHLVYHHTGSGLTLEIHWHILRPEEADFIDINQLWDVAAPARIAGVETRVLSPADLLLHLCLHLYHHRFDIGLRALCDIAEVVHLYREGLDWKQLVQRPRTGTARKVVYLALRLTQITLHTPIPGDVLSALCVEDASEWEVVLWEKILNPEAATLALGMPGLVQLWGKQPPRQKARALLRGLFPSPEILSQIYAVPVGSLCYFTYYPRYLTHVFRKFGLTAWRLIRGNKDLKLLVYRLDALDHWLQSP
jgi:hypothetical protein